MEQAFTFTDDNGITREITFTTEPYTSESVLVFMAKAYVMNYLSSDYGEPDFYLEGHVIKDMCQTYVPDSRTPSISESGEISLSSSSSTETTTSSSSSIPVSTVSVSTSFSAELY